MKRPLPPHRRALAILTVATVVALAIGGATHGWKSVPYVLPIPLAVLVFVYLNAGRDTDYGAALRFQLDERQQLQRLKTQALVGRVLSVAVAIAYVVVLAARTTVWPWAILLGLMAASFLAGRLIYGERDRGDSPA